MREIQYKTFSWRIHRKNWFLKSPNVCQFELTFGCGLHCRHCYTDCYNKSIYLKKELKTKEIKKILDKVYKRGIVWLCFSGGDPLTRKDFLELYVYAKQKGFIVTIFTNAYSMTKEIAGYLKKSPPFVIEITLNAVREERYEKISQVKGSFVKVTQGIDLILKSRLPLKIKTQVTRDNLEELEEIKKFVEGIDLKFQPSADLFARLNGDLTSCSLRLSPQEILNLNAKFNSDCLNEVDEEEGFNGYAGSNDFLFRCAIGSGDGIQIDPYGNTFLCNLIRKPAFNLLKTDIEYTQKRLLPLVKERRFCSDSKCRNCNLQEFCHCCPGRAYLETGNPESAVDYYCRLAEVAAEQYSHNHLLRKGEPQLNG